MNGFRYLAVGMLALACAGDPGRDPLPALPPPVAATSEPSTQDAPDRTTLPAPGPLPAWVLPSPSQVALSSGAPLYFLQQGATPLVTLLLVLPRGAATDPKGKAGLTFLTTDMLDEGAGGKNALEFSEALQRLGTEYAGSTDVDHVVLSMNLIAENFEPSVALLADIVRRPALSAKEFARRKDQRLADALTDESEPAHTRAVVMRKALFGDGYGGTLPEGTHDTLKRLSLADVKNQYKNLFQPDGAAFVVVGGIDQGAAKSALEKHFADWKGASKTKTAPLATAAPKSAVYFVNHKDASQSAIALARRAAGQASDEYFPALIFNRAFGGAFTSRVNMNLREDKGYTYGARSVFSRFPEVGMFVIAANVKRETTRASVDEVLKELAAMCGPRPLTDKERAESVGGLLLGYPGRFESNNGVASELADLPVYGRSTSWLSQYPGSVEAVSVASANAVGKKYCDDKDFVIVVSGDEKTVLPTLEGLERPVLHFDARGNQLRK